MESLKDITDLEKADKGPSYPLPKSRQRHRLLKREIVIKISLNKFEHEALKKKADRLTLPLAEYIRAAATHTKLRT